MKVKIFILLIIAILFLNDLILVENKYLNPSPMVNNIPIIPEELEPKVLIIGIDGVRGDVAKLSAEREGSGFGQLMENGTWSFNSTVGPISLSGPSWSSMLTGVWCDRHGVVDNSFEGSKHAEVKNIFEMIEDDQTEYKTAALYYWSKIGTEIIGENQADIQERYQTDIEIKNRTIELINNDTELDLLFISIDNVDSTGHEYGFSPNITEYVDAVESADDMVAEILLSLNKRNKSGEDWLVIITSDHGGGGLRPHAHSPSTLIDRTTFMLSIGGSSLPGEISSNPVVVDVAVSTLIHLDISLPEETKKLDGRGVLFEDSIPDAREATCIRPESNYEKKMNLMENIFIISSLLFITVYVGKIHLKTK